MRGNTDWQREHQNAVGDKNEIGDTKMEEKVRARLYWRREKRCRSAKVNKRKRRVDE